MLNLLLVPKSIGSLSKHGQSKNCSETTYLNAQKMKYSSKDFFSKYDQIRRKLRIWSHSLKKSLMENFTFCAVSARNARVKRYTQRII